MKMNEELTRACILACQKCAMLCEQCAVTCSLSSKVNSLSKPVELAMHCADMCRLTIAFLKRGELNAMRFCSLCAEICEMCAEECEKHNEPACRAAALACKECVEECRNIATGALGFRMAKSAFVLESA